MKFDLELETEAGCVSISLNRDFEDGEIEQIMKFAKSLVLHKRNREEAFAWNVTPTYYELRFGNPSNKILAIKAVRSSLGCGLKEAKDMVEGTMRIPPLSEFNAKVIKANLDREGIKDYTLTPQ